jgi:hypothetical protein
MPAAILSMADGRKYRAKCMSLGIIVDNTGCREVATGSCIHIIVEPLNNRHLEMFFIKGVFHSSSLLNHTLCALDYYHRTGKVSCTEMSFIKGSECLYQVSLSRGLSVRVSASGGLCPQSVSFMEGLECLYRGV